jgi:predicted esterase
MCLPGTEITDAQVHPSGNLVSALVTRPTDDGPVTDLKIFGVSDGSEATLSFDAGLSGGRGLSGGMHVWRPDGAELLACCRDGRVVRAIFDGGSHAHSRALEIPFGASWSTPQYSRDGKRVALVADWTKLAVHNIAAAEWGTVYDAVDGYAMDAAWHRGGATCHAWTRPEMAWTSSFVLGIAQDRGVAVQQPRGSLHHDAFGWITDENGVVNVLIEGDDIVGETVIIEDECEHGGPTWGPGQRTWCFNSDGTKVAYTRNEAGFGSLWVYDRLTEERHMVARAVHGCLSWNGDTLAAIRSGARTPQQLVAYDVSDPPRAERKMSVSYEDTRWKSEFDDELVEPSVRFADGVPYRLYEPASPNGRLIAWVHGGPTDQWQVTWRPRFTYWLSRGYAIAVVDPRGSTGFGRAHQLALEGLWGSADADDLATATRHAQGILGVTPSRTVLTGGSAGGLTVLSAANRHKELAACVVALYPVVDLPLLLESDDPFEGHYNHVLIGDVTASPNLDVRNLRDVPVLVFHGDRDELVVPDHSHRLKGAVEGAGGSVRIEMMEGEGHGFRTPANMMREYAVTEEFLEVCLP